MKKSLQSYLKIALIAILTVIISVIAVACGDNTDSGSDTAKGTESVKNSEITENSEGNSEGNTGSESESTESAESAGSTDSTESEKPAAKYKITFVCNGVTLSEIEVKEGELPVYDGETPTKDSTAEKQFAFKGWIPELVAATENATYTADFTETIRKYAVKIGDGEATEAEYGSLLEKPETDPTKEPTVSTVYAFDGWYNGETKWNFETDTVTGNVTLVAKFTESTRKYTVKIGDGEATEAEYGSLLEKPETDPTKEPTVSTVYAFDGWYNGEAKWNFETDTVTGNVTLVAKFDEVKRVYKVTVDGVTKDYEFGAKIDKPAAKKGCLIIAKDADGAEWKFDTDVVRGDVTLTTENRLINANGSELYAFKAWDTENAEAITELNSMEKGKVHLNPVNFDGNGMRVAAAANQNVTVVFPKINYNAYGKVEFKFTCNWGTRLIYIGDTVQSGDANKLGSYKGNANGDWNEYYIITIEGTSVKMFDRSGAEILTWINGAIASVKISNAVASGEDALKLTIAGGGQNLEFSDIFCHLVKSEDLVAVHEWTADEVANAESRYPGNLTYSRVASGSTPTSKWAFDWQGRMKGVGTGYAGVKIPLIKFNDYAAVSFYVYCNWGTRMMKTGDSNWLDQYTVGTVGNTGDTYEQYGIITVKGGKLYFRLNTDEVDTEVRTLTDEVLGGSDNIILSFKDGGGNNIVISDFYCSAADYINGLT